MNIFETSFAIIDFDNEAITWKAGKFNPKKENLIRKVMKSKNWGRDFGTCIVSYLEAN